MKGANAKLTFTCTDRLGETKNLELALDVNDLGDEHKKELGNNDKKLYNKILIEKLKEFQVKVNSEMTVFVENEKEAVASKKLSNDHLKKDNKKADNEEESSDEDAEEGEDAEKDEDIQNDLKKNKRSQEELGATENSTEKKPCL